MHLHVLLLLLVGDCGGAQVQIDGAGASFPVDVYSAWLPAYKAHRSRWLDLSMKYDAVGSGEGIARMKGAEGQAVAYAGSESALSESEYSEYPDLQMLPSLAGAIVMAYRVPGLTNLNLKMADIVGIYNGSIRHWNHSSIAHSNPGVKMPDERIHVAARRDNSGTTELFTSFLSDVDGNWNKTFGTFRLGLREDDDVPYRWDPQVVTLFGETNRGVSGLILSTKYSIGYLVQSDAVTSRLPFATLVNKAGTLVKATPDSVRGAMDDFVGSFTDRMTTSLTNPPGPYSYPIAAYTYLIVRKTTMHDCAVARELVRYVEWFYTNPLPRAECENLDMTPLSAKVYTKVIDTVLKKMTCQSQNVYRLVADDKEYEEISSQTWRQPVYITVPIFSVLFIFLLLYLVRDQIRLNRALLRNEWRLTSDDLVLDGEEDKNSQSFGSRAVLTGSRNKVSPSLTSLGSDSSRVHAISLKAGLRIGLWRGRRVLLAEQYVLSRAVNLRMRRSILWMRDHVRHANISDFYGLYLNEGLYSVVSSYSAKGDLQTLLHGTRYNIDNNFKFALCLGVAKGMAYLHSQKLIHGSLTSSKIFIDDQWSVRVGSWEAHTLASYQGKTLPPSDMEVGEWAKDEFWAAPELLKGRSPPTTHSDVYSFAIVVQEIFSRDIPYAEQSGYHSPNETLEQIVAISLRPVFTADTPLEARDIMQRAWEMDPLGRPPFSNIVNSIRKACPKIRSVMDSMMESLTQYVGELEDTIGAAHRSVDDKGNEKTDTSVDVKQGGTEKSEALARLLSLPPDVLRGLSHGGFETQLFECVTVLVSSVHGMDMLLRVSTPQEISDMLTDLHQALDSLLDEKDVLKVHVINDVYTLVAGLPRRKSDHLKTIATVALSMLSMARTFTIRHRREDRLRMRVGLSTGSVAAGLVGNKPCRLFVLGEAVTRAQSMAATGLPMTIQMTEATYVQISTLRTFTSVERKVAEQGQDSRQSAAKTYWLIGSKLMTETFTPESW